MYPPPLLILPTPLPPTHIHTHKLLGCTRFCQSSLFVAALDVEIPSVLLVCDRIGMYQILPVFLVCDRVTMYQILSVFLVCDRVAMYQILPVFLVCDRDGMYQILSVVLVCDCVGCPDSVSLQCL